MSSKPGNGTLTQDQVSFIRSWTAYLTIIRMIRDNIADLSAASFAILEASGKDVGLSVVLKDDVLSIAPVCDCPECKNPSPSNDDRRDYRDHFDGRN